MGDGNYFLDRMYELLIQAYSNKCFTTKSYNTLVPGKKCTTHACTVALFDRITLQHYKTLSERCVYTKSELHVRLDSLAQTDKYQVLRMPSFLS